MKPRRGSVLDARLRTAAASVRAGLSRESITVRSLGTGSEPPRRITVKLLVRSEA